MEIQRLKLEDYRSYPSLDLELGPGMHVFAGANAQGKTNLLEAVYFLATAHSPRTNQEAELISWDAEIAHLTGEFISDIRGSFTIEAALGRKATAQRSGNAQKRIKVNGAQRKVADLAGLMPVVLFLVEDLDIVRGEPARRRAFLDTDLSAMSRTYGWALKQYSRVVEQRNKLLKDIREGLSDAAMLSPWNHQMASFGGRLLEVRMRFVADLNREITEVYQGLTASSQGMTIHYHREWGNQYAAPITRQEFASLLSETLEENVQEEIRRGSSLAGPHRDDLHIQVDEKDVRQFGSQGEQRTAALALRVAEFYLLQRLIGEAPVLLLDDILSELDSTRRAALLNHLSPMAQVIVTTTDVDAVGLPPHSNVKLYRVSNGAVENL